MQPIEIKPDIYWVGGIDWDLRNFHGYLTQRGSTYNAYLIRDEKIVLVDTVKHYLFEEMLARISKVVDPASIDIIISNHVEMDHSGSIGKLLKVAPNAEVVTSPHGEKGLSRHFKEDWNFRIVQSGDTLNIGKRTLHFQQLQMVHWPDSMATYLPDEKLLLPNDAFGQHIATAERFDDEVGWDIIYEEAAKYYANIVFPYAEPVLKALDAVSTLDIDMIAPSHGVIWRKNIDKIVKAYSAWAKNESENRALIIYDSMWGTTENIARTLQESLEAEGVTVTMRNLKTNHISDIMTDVLFSKLILLGSPTLNKGMLPTMGAFLTYLKGLRPQNRIGFAFSSYGWGGLALKEMEEVLKSMNWHTPVEGINIKYIPDENELNDVREKGAQLAMLLKET